jgi:hypothetical protein
MHAVASLATSAVTGFTSADFAKASSRNERESGRLKHPVAIMCVCVCGHPLCLDE